MGRYVYTIVCMYCTCQGSLFCCFGRRLEGSHGTAQHSTALRPWDARAVHHVEEPWMERGTKQAGLGWAHLSMFYVNCRTNKSWREKVTLRPIRLSSNGLNMSVSGIRREPS